MIPHEGAKLPTQVGVLPHIASTLSIAENIFEEVLLCIYV